MAFQPGLMNRALSNREMFRQVQTMPVTAYDPRPRKAQELMDYVSEGTEGQFDRPIIKMKPSGSRRRGGGSREEGAGTETGQNLANLMGSIVKESTTGKRYVEEGTEGQPGLTDDDEFLGAYEPPHVQRAYKQHAKDRVAWRRRTGDIPSDKQVPPPFPDPGESIRRQKAAERSKGSRGHFDAGHI